MNKRIYDIIGEFLIIWKKPKPEIKQRDKANVMNLLVCDHILDSQLLKRKMEEHWRWTRKQTWQWWIMILMLTEKSSIQQREPYWLQILTEL